MNIQVYIRFPVDGELRVWSRDGMRVGGEHYHDFLTSLDLQRIATIYARHGWDVEVWNVSCSPISRRFGCCCETPIIPTRWRNHDE